jgi:hypothetical protein
LYLNFPTVNTTAVVDCIDLQGKIVFSCTSLGGNCFVPANRITSGVVIVRISLYGNSSARLFHL